jgi:hypothetical protein
MSRYNGNNGGSSSSGDYDDQKTLKLQEYAAVRLVPSELSSFSHDSFGTSFISNFSEAEVLDGVVFQRDDKPDTWKVFSAGKFFNLNPEDGLVYEKNGEDGYTGEMSAQDILDHPRVAGFSENFGGNDYFYTPVAAIIEENDDIAVNDDLDLDVTDENTIKMGETAMLLGNKTWVRTFAKKMEASGHNIINDNGEDPTPRGEPDTNPKYDDHEWLTTEEPELRSDLEGRELELWLTEEKNTWDDGEETEFTSPNLLDTKTGEFVTIDNGVEPGEEDESDSQEAATDGGTKAESGSTTNESGTSSPDTEPSSTDSTDGSALPEGVPDKLEDLLGYLARNNDEVSVEQVREFAEDEVDDADEVDWEAAADAANQM